MKPRAASPDTAATSPAAASKTRRKQAMHELQALGEALVAIDERHLATLDLPERLVDAIALARTLTRHESVRRQLQYVGRLMRDVDPEPIRAALKRWNEGPREERARFAALEAWRERLLDEPSALDAFASAFPNCDAAALEPLIVAARAERGMHGTPHKQRELFRLLRRITDPPGPERQA